MHRLSLAFILTSVTAACGDDGGTGGAGAGGVPGAGGAGAQGAGGDGQGGDGQGGAAQGGQGQGGDGQGGDGQGGDGKGGAAQGGDGQGGDGGGAECAQPESGLWATFDVAGEVYRAQITHPNGIQQALDLWAGTSSANIPNGQLVCGNAAFNCTWGFYQDPATIEFAELTIEVCDGTPSYVDANCESFGAQYCPWSAELIELRDCRTDPTCPAVP